MQRSKPIAIRNKIDLADASQIRSLKKRLGVSTEQLQRVVAKVGNSIAAVSKELQKNAPPVTEALPVQVRVDDPVAPKIEVAA